MIRDRKLKGIRGGTFKVTRVRLFEATRGGKLEAYRVGM